MRLNIKDFIGRSMCILGGGRLCITPSMQSRHEVIGLVRVLTFAAVYVGKGGADLTKTKVGPYVRETFKAGKRHPFGHLMRTQAP